MKRIKTYLIIYAITMFCHNIAHSQAVLKDLLNNEERQTLPFEIKHGFIIVDLKLNNIIPLKFIFDTGSKHTILFEKGFVDILNLTHDKRIKILGADVKKELYALIYRNISLKLKNLKNVKRDIVILEENISLFDEMIGFDVDGIIGGSFFKNLVVEIDYKKKRIHFHNPDTYVLPEKYEYSTELKIINDKPYMEAKYHQTVDSEAKDLHLLIDTGAALSYLIHVNSDSTLSLPDQIIPGFLGSGLGGDITGYIGKTHLFSFGNYQFHNIVTSYQDLDVDLIMRRANFRNGIVGFHVLSRFSIVIDYVKGKIHWNASKKYNKKFNFDKSGLHVLMIGNQLDQFYVKNVIPNSPAHQAGIQDGDLIKKINGFPSHLYSLQTLDRLLRKKEGKSIRMVIERNGERKKMVFKLRDYISRA